MNTEQTIGSKELAKIAGSRHDSVKRSIERLAKDGIVTFTPLVEKSYGGRPVTEYAVGERDSYVIVAQLSPEFTAKLVDRWRELEAGQTQPLGFVPDIRDFDAEIAKAREESDWKTARDFCLFEGITLTNQQKYELGKRAAELLKLETNREPYQYHIGWSKSSKSVNAVPVKYFRAALAELGFVAP